MASRTLFVVLATAALLVAACGGSGDAAPTPTPGATAAPTATVEPIALPLRPDGPELYAVAPDGSSLRLLFDEGSFFGYALSPDGSAIALAAVRDDETILYLIDTATGEREELLRADWLHVRSWSPDGRWLSLGMIPELGGADGSYVYDLDAREVLALPERHTYPYVWSPFGDALYVGRGSSPPTLARIDVPSFDVEPLDVTFDDIAVAPDGVSIAVGRFLRDPTGVSPHFGYVIDLVVLDGSATRRLVELDETTFVAGGLAWSPDGGRLAYSRFAIGEDRSDSRDFDSGMYVVDIETAAVTRLSDAPSGVDTSGAWSADGSHLLVRRHVCTQCDGAGSKYLLARADGGGEIALPGVDRFEISDGAWSPDGGRVAYSGDRLYAAGIDDPASPVTLADMPASAYTSITWAPDASGVYFVRSTQLDSVLSAVQPDGSGLESFVSGAVPSPDGVFTVAFDRDTGEAVVTNANGEFARLRHEALADARIDTSDLYWSPDSAWLALLAGEKGGEQLLLWSAQGTGELRLVDTAERVGRIRWSPDSSRFAYSSTAGIAAVDAATGAEELLVDGGSYSAFDWSPDGERIAVVKGASVTIVDLGGERRHLADLEPRFNAVAFRWSPDGARLAIADFGSVLLLSVETGEVERTILGVTQGFAWSPDGSQLAFAMHGSQDQLSPGVHLLDVESDALVQLTEATLRAHSIRGWLDDGRLLFESIHTL